MFVQLTAAIVALAQGATEEKPLPASYPLFDVAHPRLPLLTSLRTVTPLGAVMSPGAVNSIPVVGTHCTLNPHKRSGNLGEDRWHHSVHSP